MAGVPPEVDPKPVSFEQSYSNSLVNQRNAGQPAPALNRQPQKLPQQQKPGVAAAPQAGAQAAPAPKAANAAGRALVKAVPSGDTLVLWGSAGGQVAQEKIVRLTGVTAPRVGRPAKGEKKNDDQPYAWESREFLRKLVIGTTVSFQVNHAAENAEYAVVRLDDGRSLSEVMVSAGWATANAGKKGGQVHPERQALIDLQTQAEQAKAGMWAFGKEKEAEHVRAVDYEPDTKALFAAWKGARLPGVVEYVRDGSTIRVLVMPKPREFKTISLILAGVQAPNIPPQGQASQQALAAREYVEMRLLHRDVSVVLQGTDKGGNLFGTLDFEKGNISVYLLKNGLARYVAWSGALTANPAELQAAEASARAQKLGVWSANAAAAAAGGDDEKAGGGSVMGKEFAGTVVQVVSGDCLVVAGSKGETRRLYLASVLAPRMGNPRKNVDDEPFAHEAREFVRKRVIGKRVTGTVVYTRKRGGAAGGEGGETLEFADVFAGKGSLAEALVAAGLADVSQHRPNDARSADYEALLAAEERAKTKKAGKYSGASGKTPVFVDLTQRMRGEVKSDDVSDAAAKERKLIAKAQQLLPLLKRDKTVRGVVEYVFSATRLKVALPTHECVIPVILSGVRDAVGFLLPRRGGPGGPRKGGNEQGARDENGKDAAADEVGAAPAAAAAAASGDQNPALKAAAEAVNDKAYSFVESQCLQQDVVLEIEEMDKQGVNFIGNVLVHGRNLAELLLEQGLVAVFGPSAERNSRSSALFLAEERAQGPRIGLWQHWSPPAPKPAAASAAAAAAAAAPAAAAEVPEGKEVAAEERQISLRITNIVDGASFYAQQVGAKNNAVVEEKMRAFNPPPAPAGFAPKRGGIYAGLFTEDNQWHRVRIEQKAADGAGYNVFFVDYGNSDTVPVANLRPLGDESLTKIPPLARLYTLSAVKGPSRNSGWHESAMEMLSELAFGRDVSCSVDLKGFDERFHVTVRDPDSGASVAETMLRAGLLRILRKPERRLAAMAEALKPAEEEAKREHRGVWEYGNVSDDEDADPRERRGL